MKTLLRLLLPLIPFLLGGCSQPTGQAGGGSVIGNPPIAASLQDRDGRPVSLAHVRLFKADHDPVSVDTAMAEATSDSAGKVLILGVPAGTYNIVAEENEGRLLGLSAGIVVPADVRTTDTVHAPACVMDAPSAITIPFAGLGAAAGDFLFLPGTPCFREIDSASLRAGFLTLERVPAGEYSALLHSKGAAGAAVNILRKPLTAVAGETVVVGTFQAWRQSRQVFINTSASGAATSGSVQAFPLLLRLDSTSLDFAAAGDSGQNLRFAKADGISPLAHQIVRWGPADIQVWVRVDTIRADDGAQFIYLFSGLDSQASGSDGGAVFDTADGFAAVWHLGDDPEGVQPVYLDAAPARNHGTGMGLPAASRVEGVIGRAVSFDGATQFIQVPDASGLSLRAATFSAWISSDSLGGRILEKAPPSGGGYAFDTFAGRIRLAGPSGNQGSQTDLPRGAFVHVAATFEGGATRYFLNGKPDGVADSLLSLPTNASALRIGSAADGTGRFRGIIDELQISRIARSADWIKLSFENQKPGSRVISVR